MRRLLPLLLCATLATSFSGVAAQEQASLVADSLYINADSTLVAEGSVEVFYKGSRLVAHRLTYDKATDRLKIEGPITLTDGQGTRILADTADLSSDLRDGILESARMVLQDQLRLNADTIRRSEGRYTELKHVFASSCQVCAAHPVPLWEIRAARVLHDQDEHQLYFDNATFRLGGVPVLYIPHLRMPDPTLKRATGFLLPKFTSSSTLGTGIALPYFIAIGDDRDVTLTPFAATRDAQALSLRYRQAFENGQIDLTGAIAHDDILPGNERGYLLGTGEFNLARGYVAGFQIEAASDDAVLLEYGITDKDRLGSGVYVTRTKRDRYFDARLFRYHSLREGDDNDTLPSTVGDVTLVRRYSPNVIGGQASLSFDLHALMRDSSATTDVNGDGVVDGRDMARSSITMDWRRQDVLENGMVLGLATNLTADMFVIGQDSTYDSLVTHVTPTAMVDLRWPWVRARAQEPTQILEPVVQLVWSPEDRVNAPNEDSALVEFDEGNLFSLGRYPGADIHERGLRANIGVNWSRLNPDGLTTRVTAGRIFRSEDLAQFSTGSSLAGTTSDWLVAGQVTTADGLSFTNRAIFDDDFSFAMNELRFGLDRKDYNFAMNYVWLEANPSEDRPAATSELAFEAGWQVKDGWRALASGRYDLEENKTTRAGLGVQYSNECAIVDLSLSRRFTSSTTVQPTTELSLTFALAGFGGGTDGRSYRRTCGM